MSLVLRRRRKRKGPKSKAQLNRERLRRNLMARKRRARLTGRPVGKARPTNGRRKGRFIKGGKGRKRRKVKRKPGRALVVRRKTRRRKRPTNGRFKGSRIAGTRRRRRLPRKLTRAQKNRRNLMARKARARRTGRPVGRARPKRRGRRALVVRRKPPARRRQTAKQRVLSQSTAQLRRTLATAKRRARGQRLEPFEKRFIADLQREINKRGRAPRRRRAPARRGRRPAITPRIGPRAITRAGVRRGGVRVLPALPIPPPLGPGASATARALREDKLRLRRNRMSRERARAKRQGIKIRFRKPGGPRPRGRAPRPALAPRRARAPFAFGRPEPRIPLEVRLERGELITPSMLAPRPDVQRAKEQLKKTTREMERDINILEKRKRQANTLERKEEIEAMIKGRMASILRAKETVADVESGELKF